MRWGYATSSMLTCQAEWRSSEGASSSLASGPVKGPDRTTILGASRGYTTVVHGADDCEMRPAGVSVRGCPQRWRIHRSMRDLSTYRQDWEERRIVEGNLLRRMTIAESVSEMKSLYHRCRQQLAEDDFTFFEERVKYLTEMQRRLQRLDQYLARPDIGRSV